MSYWCTNCQGYRSPASTYCNNSCNRNCNNRCATCSQYTLISASSDLAIQQSSQQNQIRELMRGVNVYGGKLETKIEDRRPDGSVYRTTTHTYYPPK